MIMNYSEYYVYENDLDLTESQKEKITELLMLTDGAARFTSSSRAFLVTDNLVKSQRFTCEEEAYQLNNKIDAIVAEDD